MCRSNCACDTRVLVFIIHAFPTEIGRSSLAGLEDNWGFFISGGLESSHDSRAGGHIDGWDCIVVLLSVEEKGAHIVADDA